MSRAFTIARPEPPAPLRRVSTPSPFYTSVEITKNESIKLGRVVHKNPECVTLKKREVFTISGSIISTMKVCDRCEFPKD